MNVERVITWELLVSMPAQLVKILAAAMASNIFFCELTTMPSSSARLLRVKSPRGRMKEKPVYECSVHKLHKLLKCDI